MKKDYDIIKVAAIGFVGLVVIPVIVGGVIKMVTVTYVGGSKLINNVKQKRRIKKGLKDGTIVEYEGQYYEVTEEDKGE